jgi:hypothetical protein
MGRVYGLARQDRSDLPRKHLPERSRQSGPKLAETVCDILGWPERCEMCARVAAQEGAALLGVSSLEEGEALRAAGLSPGGD